MYAFVLDQIWTCLESIKTIVLVVFPSYEDEKKKNLKSGRDSVFTLKAKEAE